ncbi:MarR family winged helix-turn-helix transcriptional regulator [Pirellulaceae bacterium SH449]
MSLGDLLNRNQSFDVPLQEFIFTTIFTADRFEASLNAYLKPFGLTPCQYDILTVLDDADGEITTGEIGKRLVKQTTALGAYLDRLEKNGMLLRKRSDEDRRQVYVSLSGKGRSNLKRIHENLTAWEERIIGHLTHSEAVSATKILRKAAHPTGL